MNTTITGQQGTSSQFNRDVYATTSSDVNPIEPRLTTQVRQAIGDEALGIGHAVALTKELRLLDFAPKISRIMAGVPRFLGAGVTLATSGYDVAKTFVSDLDAGGRDFTRTRNELVATSAAVGSGVLMGTLAGIGGAALITAGAPAVLVGGLGVAAAIGIGAATSKVRGWVSDWIAS